MNSIERRQPTTRRRRIAHLGVGGVLAAVAGSQAGAAIAGVPRDPEPHTAPSPEPIARAGKLPHHHLPPLPVPAVARSRPHPDLPASGNRLPEIPAVWVALARCESGGNWRDTDGMFFGGLQFAASTWTSFDVGHYALTADQATPTEQIIVARRVLARQGVGAWPNCGPIAGLEPGD